MILLLDKDTGEEGWWKGESNEKIGIFPANMVEIFIEVLPWKIIFCHVIKYVIMFFQLQVLGYKEKCGEYCGRLRFIRCFEHNLPLQWFMEP